MCHYIPTVSTQFLSVCNFSNENINYLSREIKLKNKKKKENNEENDEKRDYDEKKNFFPPSLSLLFESIFLDISKSNF